MKARSVQDLIDLLEKVDDKSRTVMVAGGGPWDGVDVLGVWECGQVIIWCAEKYAEAGYPGTLEWSRRRWPEATP